MESLPRKRRLISRGKRAALNSRPGARRAEQLPWQRREIQLHRKRGAKGPLALREARLIRPLP